MNKEILQTQAEQLRVKLQLINHYLSEAELAFNCIFHRHCQRNRKIEQTPSKLKDWNLTKTKS